MVKAPSSVQSLAKVLCTLAAIAGGCTQSAAPVPPKATPVPSKPTPVSTKDSEWAGPRERMVEQQLAARGIRNKRVLAAMGRVPRHEFVPEDIRPAAYDDRALPIG